MLNISTLHLSDKLLKLFDNLIFNSINYVTFTHFNKNAVAR